jgi:hypothetical protein
MAIGHASVQSGPPLTTSGRSFSFICNASFAGLLQQALRIHPKAPHMHLAYFRMELQYAQSLLLKEVKNLLVCRMKASENERMAAQHCTAEQYLERRRLSLSLRFPLRLTYVM